MAGVARDRVGPFSLSLEDQTSCDGVDSPDVQKLSQPFSKRFCAPVWPSRFTGMQDFPSLSLLSRSPGNSSVITLRQGGGEGGLPCSCRVRWGGTTQQGHDFVRERSPFPVCPLFKRNLIQQQTTVLLLRPLGLGLT